MLLEIKLSPDLNWIFKSISDGFYNTNHPINFNKFLYIFQNTENYFIFNFLLLIFLIYLIWKRINNYFSLLIIFFILVLNCFFYIQKDNIFLVAFGVYFIYAFNSRLIGLIDEFIIFLIIFIAYLAFPLFGLLLFFGFIILCNKRAQYIIIFSLMFLSIYQWEPLKKQDSYSFHVKLNHVIASDSINVSKRINDFSIIPSDFFTDKEASIECILNYDNSNNLINPHGIANIDYISNNKCINLNNKLSTSDYLKIINNIYFKNFIDYSAVKFSHAFQLLVRPYNNNVFIYLAKVILGPIWLIILIIYLIYLRDLKSLLIIFPVYIHLSLIILFAPGYDIRYTYPEFISIIFLYLIISKNEFKNKNFLR
jgi:hypothetical protein